MSLFVLNQSSLLVLIPVVELIILLMLRLLGHLGEWGRHAHGTLCGGRRTIESDVAVGVHMREVAGVIVVMMMQTGRAGHRLRHGTDGPVGGRVDGRVDRSGRERRKADLF